MTIFRGVKLRSLPGPEVARRGGELRVLTTSPRSDMREFLADLERHSPYFAVGAENEEGEILGWGTCYRLGTLGRAVDVFVREDCRGRGLGRALLTDLLRDNSAAGYPPPLAETNLHPSFWSHFSGRVDPV